MDSLVRSASYASCVPAYCTSLLGMMRMVMRHGASAPFQCSGSRRHMSSSRRTPFSLASSSSSLSSSCSSASLSSWCGPSPKGVSRRYVVQDTFFPTVVLPEDLPKRLILVRHGESEANVDRSQYAHLPDWRISLTARGIKEAQHCGRRLRNLVKDEPLFIYYSPYQRTRQTLDEIRRSLNPLQIMGEREDERLREQEMGNYQPLPASGEMDDLWDARNTYGRSFFRFPCGESGLDVMDRVGSFFDALLKEGSSHRWWKKEQLLPVSHASSSHSAPPPKRTPTTTGMPSTPTIRHHTNTNSGGGGNSGTTTAAETKAASPTSSAGPPPPPPPSPSPSSSSVSACRSSSRYVGGPSPSSHVLPVFFHTITATSVFGNPTATSDVGVATTTTSIPVLTRANRETGVPSLLSSVAPSSTVVKAEGGDEHHHHVAAHPGQGEVAETAAACHTTTTTAGEEDVEGGGAYTVVSTTTVFAVAPRLSPLSPTISSFSSSPVPAGTTATPLTTSVLTECALPSMASITTSSSLTSSLPGARGMGKQETTTKEEEEEKARVNAGKKDLPTWLESATTTTTTIIDRTSPSGVPSHSTPIQTFSPSSSLSCDSPSSSSLHLSGAFTEHPASLSFPSSSSSALYASLVQEEEEEDYTDVIVSHGLLIRLFISRWFGIPAEKRELLLNPPNCSLIVLERTRGTKDFRLTEKSKKLFGDALKDVL